MVTLETYREKVHNPEMGIEVDIWSRDQVRNIDVKN